MRKVLVVLLLGGMISFACATVLVPPKPPAPPPAKIDTEAAYVNWRRVAMSTDPDTCPRVESWKGESWLDAAFKRASIQPTEKDKELFHRLQLDRFCIYEATYSNPGPAPEEWQKLPQGLVRVDRDRMAVISTGPLSDIGQRTWESFAQSFDQQAGRPTLPGLTATPSVRLAFLDTEPTRERILVRDEPPFHGNTLAHLAQHLLCDDAATHCAAKVTTRLAMPRESSMGTTNELATAILDEVLEFRVPRREATPRHLILNLSLGWDGELFGDLDEGGPLETSVAQVYGALQIAAADQVLVIAAAGNRRGGPRESRWPVLPAAWELHRAPWPSALPAGTKLVYAVGAVDRDGRPLGISRRGGLPTRVAYGDHAVTAVDFDRGTTAMYTGTSVSTAVVSAAAAALWHLRPDLRPQEVMEHLDGNAEPLPGQADYHDDHGPRNLHRISLCIAAMEGCPSCTDFGPDCGTGPAPDVDRQIRESGLFPSPGGPSEVGFGMIPVANRCESGASFLNFENFLPDLPCPSQQVPFLISRRWTTPQPQDPPCPTCVLVPRPPHAALENNLFLPSTPPTAALALQIMPEWRDFLPQVLTLDLACDGERGTDYVHYNLPTMDLFRPEGQPAPLMIENIRDVTGCTATLSYVFDKGGTPTLYQSPVFVAPGSPAALERAATAPSPRAASESGQ